jgi:N-acetylmuramoyl-L-alanine amidase
LTPPLKPIVARLTILATLIPIALAAQQPHPIILIDPAHGGSDTGARFSDQLLEKDIALSFATNLRTALSASGFTVIATRDTDTTTLFTADQRAEIANHAQPAACLILHATSSGNGIHIITSALAPINEVSNTKDTNDPPSWQDAQAAFLPQSLRLANELGLALLRAKLPVILTESSIRPLDNLTCPAVAIEIAPLTTGHSIPAADADYQHRIAQAIAIALTSWRTHAAPSSSPTAGAPR